jgi:23S rRNA (guanine745-N1)-methyltransferase
MTALGRRNPPLACTVRGCGLPLEQRQAMFGCASGHTYDIARSGYVNLLQPQDRRSLNAGDSREAVAARAALLTAGVGRALIDAVCAKAISLSLATAPVVVDLGSGSGDALAALGERLGMRGIGIDLSTAAADHAARRFPSHTWVVANADRRLPLLDARVDLLVSLHGRRHPEEADRVLAADGVMLIAVPAPDDLIELRALVQGEGVERDRGETLVVAHQAQFELVERSSIGETLTLDREMLLNLLRATYRGARLASAQRVALVDRMQVTLSSEVFVLRKSQGNSIVD